MPILVEVSADKKNLGEQNVKLRLSSWDLQEIIFWTPFYWYLVINDCEINYQYTIPYFSLVVTKPPYEITETGWGEFEIVIKIFFNDPNERPVSESAE